MPECWLGESRTGDGTEGRGQDPVGALDPIYFTTLPRVRFKYNEGERHYQPALTDATNHSEGTDG